MKKKLFLLSLIICFALIAMSVATSAAVPYVSFNYDYEGKPIQTSDIYEPNRLLVGNQLSVGDFIDPQDIFVYEGKLFVLDSGNSRIIEISEKLDSAKEIFVRDSNTQIKLEKANGLFINKSGMYIADQGNMCVWKCDSDGKVLNKIVKPDNEYFSQYLDFLPTKVTGDSVGNIYVRCVGVYQGLAIFNKDLEFQGFFGSEKVQTTSEVISSFFWKQFMTSEQKKSMSDYVPSEIYNMDMSSDNFMYTITPGSLVKGQQYKQSADSIRCLNPKGSDILNNEMPDAIAAAFENDSKRLNFIDISYDENGFINVADNKQGKIFQFDKNMRLVTAFGGTGEFLGTFTTVNAIATLGDDILVLDSTAGAITYFTPTQMGANVRKASMLYNDGDYKASLNPWKQVVEENPNFQLAYIGIGNAYYNEQEYAEAMEYYKLGSYSKGYSDAYREYRIQAVRDNYLIIIAVIVLLVIGIKLLRKYIRKARLGKEKKERSKYLMPFYIMIHPLNGFDEVYYRKKTSFLMSFAILASAIFLGVCEQQFMGNQFLMASSTAANLLKIAAIRIVLLAVFTVSNWAFCVLADGKAKLSQIWIFSTYSIIPYIICGFIRVILSHFLTSSEGVFLTIIFTVGVLWSFLLLMNAFLIFHEFTLSKAIISFVVTLIGMLLIAVLAFLAYSLMQQLIDNVLTVFSEIMFRINS